MSRAFTLSAKLEAGLRHMHCAVCGHGPLAELGVEWDHIAPWAMSKDRSAANCQPLCPECHAKKTDGLKATSYGSDKHEIAKVKRLANGPRKRRGRTIKSRGFDKHLKQKFNGDVEARNA